MDEFYKDFIDEQRRILLKPCSKLLNPVNNEVLSLKNGI
jgi:hypothetical protein